MKAIENTSARKLRIIFLTPFADYGFFVPVRQGMEDAAKAMGVEATFTGTDDGNVKELAGMVGTAVQEGYDGIALNIIDSVAFDKAVSEADAKGVPVIAFNVDDGKTSNARLAAVGQNMLEAGRTFGREVTAFVANNSHVLITMHDPNISALDERSAGMQEILKPRGVTWTEVVTGTDREKAVEKIRAALIADPSIKVILGTGQADTEAAGLAIERHFLGQGYVTAGFDITPDILQLIKRQVIRFTVDEQPYAQGYYSVVALTLYLRYGLKPPNIDTGVTLITADQVDQVLDLSKHHFR